MKVDDLIYIRNNLPFNNEFKYLLQIIEILPEGYYVMILNGPNIGEEHYVKGSNVISICERINLL